MTFKIDILELQKAAPDWEKRFDKWNDTNSAKVRFTWLEHPIDNDAIFESEEDYINFVIRYG